MATEKQPAPAAQHVTGMPPATPKNVQSQKKFALILGLISLVAGGAALALYGLGIGIFAVFGAYALYIGIRTKTIYLSVIGAAGLLITIAAFILGFIA